MNEYSYRPFKQNGVVQVLIAKYCLVSCFLAVSLCVLFIIYTSIVTMRARLEQSTGERVFCLFVLRENVRNFSYEEMQRSGKGSGRCEFCETRQPSCDMSWLALPVVQDVISWGVFKAVEDVVPAVFFLLPTSSLQLGKAALLPRDSPTPSGMQQAWGSARARRWALHLEPCSAAS